MTASCDTENKRYTMMPVQVLMTGDEASSSPAVDLLDPVEVCKALEQGGILYFPKTPFRFGEGDIEFLLAQRQLETAFHKNIAYRPESDKVTGIQAQSGTDTERLRQIMSLYSNQVNQFMGELAAPYKGHWHMDYASFRPVEEDGRKLRLRSRNDLLHVDSFPTRPTRGGRILRVFTNIHPQRLRVWRTSSNFEQLVGRFKENVKPYRETVTDKASVLRAFARSLGFKVPGRPPYDRWMLDFHNFLKENEDFQQSTRKDPWEFPPGSSWIVYTDMVSHAVLSGQHALEQTFIIAEDGLVQPEKAPINILRAQYR